MLKFAANITLLIASSEALKISASDDDKMCSRSPEDWARWLDPNIPVTYELETPCQNFGADGEVCDCIPEHSYPWAGGTTSGYFNQEEYQVLDR